MNQVQVTDLDHIARLAAEKKSVIVPKSEGFNKPKPAEFILGVPARALLGLFRLGMYVYEKSEVKNDVNRQS